MQSANTTLTRATTPSLSRIVLASVARVLAWDEISRSRRGLGRLDAHMLRDIGLDAATAQNQASLPFWRA